jgi:tRNA(adenine34) deaminase
MNRSERGTEANTAQVHAKAERSAGFALKEPIERGAAELADEPLMRLALAEATAAAADGDVPVGALVVGPDGAILGRGRNRREIDGDPTAHAEIGALREAARTRGGWRLEGCVVLATLEPCAMCAGALVNARIARLVYGCADPKAGAVDTLFAIGRDPRLNHRFEITSGVLAAESAAMLRAFFAARR